MTDIVLRTLVAGLRSEKTSNLIIQLNTDAMVDFFRTIDQGSTLTESDRGQIIRAIADEVDRRIPVPT